MFVEKEIYYLHNKKKSNDIQLPFFAYTRSINQPYENEVILGGQNISLKCYLPLDLLTHFRKGIRSLHTFDIGSLGQRAAKLLAFEVGGPQKNSATSAISAKVCASPFGQVSTPPGVESF